MITAGKRIAELRKQKNLSQDDLAEKANVTRQTVSRWETDAMLPNNDNLKLLMEILCADAEYILYGNHNTEAEQTEIKTRKAPRILWLILAIVLSVIAVFGLIFTVSAAIIFFQPKAGIESVTVSVFHNPQGFAVLITAITVTTASAVTLIYCLIKKKFKM